LLVFLGFENSLVDLSLALFLLFVPLVFGLHEFFDNLHLIDVNFMPCKIVPFSCNVLLGQVMTGKAVCFL
jgi:hypothetical protein